MAEKLRSSYEVANDRHQDDHDTSPNPDVGERPIQSPDTEAGRPTTEEQDQVDAINERPDAETLYKDAEILGKRYPVRRSIQEIGNRRAQAIESVQASWKNTLATPKKMRLGIAQSFAESRLSRAQARYDALSELPDTSWLKKRRLAKLDKAKAKHETAKKNYNSHAKGMQDRRDNVGKNYEKRKNDYKEGLKEKRSAALARKEIRRQIRGEGASLLEARELVKDIPKEQLNRIGKVAAYTASLERSSYKIERAKNKATRAQEKTLQRDEQSRNRQEAYKVDQDATQDRVKEINDELPDAEANLVELSDQLADLPDDDPARDELQEKVTAAEEAVQALKDERESARGRLQDIEQRINEELAIQRESQSTRDDHQRTVDDAKKQQETIAHYQRERTRVVAEGSTDPVGPPAPQPQSNQQQSQSRDDYTQAA